MARFLISTKDHKDFEYDLRKVVVTIGRAKENDIELSDKTASRRHAEIKKMKDHYILTDLDSHNGTYVNDSRITKCRLNHEDRVKISDTVLTFIENSSSELSPKEKETPIAEPPKRQTEELLNNLLMDSDEADHEVLASIKSIGIAEDEQLLSSFHVTGKQPSQFDQVDLGRVNKILWVLFQISRKLNSTTDFDELLNTIMDLIFQIIDADYGFVIVLGDKPDQIIPKAIKYGTSSEDGKKKLKVSRTIMNKVINEKTSILTTNAMDDERFGQAKSIFLQNIRSVLSVPLWRKDDVIGMIQLDSYSLENKFTKADLNLLTTISNQMAMVIEQANLSEKIRKEEMARNRLERFHSPDVVDFIVKGDQVDEEALMAPTEKYVTLLFTDIVNFTPLSEMFPPAEVSRLLNLYFQEMTDIIFEYNGTLDKYIGDAIMAVFGAPIEREDDAERAIRAAVKMRKTLLELMKNIESDRRFTIRLGINSGMVVAGNMGSPKRMDYTVIGDAVNVASRLESIAESNQILIGEETYQRVKHKFQIQMIGKKSIKGKSYPIKVYEVLD